ncbi:dermonecrotic toxin domain-containing protein [Pseudomonas sp. NBRC 111124]|uniref:dermonecrotic toxin domain-containing protein n=1 Tax=Pseudomonas sp. NBRC 111124 TaxID=1661039 RepID=UPI00076203F6|nr:DUF6543 domain-containing protein [Pseudomonas sp. NBRC 111124]
MKKRQPPVGQAGKHYVKQVLTYLPRPDRYAREAILEWARRQQLELDPDQTLAVSLHCRFVPGRGWLAQVAEEMTMTEALLTNWQDRSQSLTVQQAAQLALNPLAGAFDLLGALPELQLPHGRQPWAKAFGASQVQIVEQLPKAGLWQDIEISTVFHGLFRQSQPMRYDASTFVLFDATAFQAFIWQLEFHEVYKRQLATFWKYAFNHYVVSSRIAFLAACNQQTQQGNLSERGRSLAWRAVGVERWHHDSRLSHNGVIARMLNINGYRSSDILCLSDARNGLTLLYIPGNASPLHEFGSISAMRTWLARQCRDASKRAALLTHFCASDIADRLTRSGLATIVQGMAAYPPRHIILPATSVYRLVRVWNPHALINFKADTYSPQIENDVFTACAQAQQLRSQSDGDYLITRDSDVTKAAWRSYFYLTMNLLTPFLLVAPELVPLLAIAGAAQFGVGLDQMLNDKHLEQQEEGAEQAVFGLLNAAPGLARGVRASKTLFGSRPLGFIKPVRLNGRIGYPLSPITPPHLPGAAMSPFFRELAEVGEQAVVASLEADPHIARCVMRFRAFGTGDELMGDVGNGLQPLYYDASQDSFVLKHADGTRGAQHYIASADPLRPGTSRLVIDSEPSREISPATRSRTLRALGIDVQLPLDLDALGDERGLPVPKQVFHIWVGDRIIAGDYLDALDNNVNVLRNSDFKLKLYLSKADPQAFEGNMALLQSRMQNGLEVATLEHQAFYRQFMQSEYFEQYQAAIHGNGAVASNFSSASDILRYRILHSEGGIYLDMDDHLLTEPDLASGQPRASIDSVSLNTPLDGLLLRSPVCNAQLGLYTRYNTSMIGSRAFNPVLNDVSDEILNRYLTPEGQDFYRAPKPARENEAAFQAYTRQLNQLTGPAVLNHVIDQRLPALYTYRQLADLANIHTLYFEALLDESALRRAEQRLLPLEYVATAGNAQGY